MKLEALATLGHGDKNMADARRLAAELDITAVAGLQDLYVSTSNDRLHDRGGSDPAGDPCRGAVLGGAGEHLARRWGLPILRCVRHGARYLGHAMFWPDADGFAATCSRSAPSPFALSHLHAMRAAAATSFSSHRGAIDLPSDDPTCAPVT